MIFWVNVTFSSAVDLHITTNMNLKFDQTLIFLKDFWIVQLEPGQASFAVKPCISLH